MQISTRFFVSEEFDPSHTEICYTKYSHSSPDVVRRLHLSYETVDVV